ncbi:NOL1/NOP2/sun family putative RNA methylase [candidate division WOR-3 bacterium]|nr:NOL1/NOP2/sun family putative RNA methylase [candidate division WOR-3 bacterium]
MKLEELYSRYRPIIPDFNDFMDCISRPLQQSFRINTLKGRRDEILSLIKDVKTAPLSFYPDGFRIKEKRKIGNHIVHNLGYIYVQEIASMIPVLVLDPRSGEVVLDLCAAPGSKTTQIAQHMRNTGLLVANEMNRKRSQGLLFNLKRCGVLNEAVIGIRGQNLDRLLVDYFDRVLIDAPCSAEGTIRRSKAVLYHWGERNIETMSRIQKGLIVSGFRSLCPGGTLVYSTCTIAPEENEAVVAYLLEKFPEAEILPIAIPNLKMRPAITKWRHETYNERVKKCVRIFPQDNDTAPFFVAKITKRGILKHRVAFMGKVEFEGASIDFFTKHYGIDRNLFQGYSVFRDNDLSFISTPQVYSFREVKALRKGLEIGKIYDRILKPDNDFTQLFGRNAEKNVLDLKEHQLRKYLRGDMLKIGAIPNTDQEFIVLKYKNVPVGVGRYNGNELRSAVKRERRTA